MRALFALYNVSWYFQMIMLNRHTTKVPRVVVVQPADVHARGEHAEATDQRWGRRWTERAAQGSAYALHGR